MSKKERDDFQRGRESMHSEMEQLRALAKEAGEALVKIGRPVGNEEMWLKRDILDKLRAAGILKGGE